MKPIRLSAPGGRVTNRSGWCSSPRASERRMLSIASMHSSIGSSRRTSCSGMTSTLIEERGQLRPLLGRELELERLERRAQLVGLRGPTTTAVTFGSSSSQAMARAAGDVFRSRARSSNASSPSKTRSS